MSIKLPVKSLLHSDFLLINLKTKPLIKEFVECPQQIVANYVHVS